MTRLIFSQCWIINPAITTCACKIINLIHIAMIISFTFRYAIERISALLGHLIVIIDNDNCWGIPLATVKLFSYFDWL